MFYGFYLDVKFNELLVVGSRSMSFGFSDGFGLLLGFGCVVSCWFVIFFFEGSVFL